MYKLSKILLLVLIFSISISCHSTPIPTTETRQVPVDFLGFVHAGYSLDEYPLINEMGSVWLLQTFYWNRIEKKEGEFDFTWYDKFVNNAKENKKKVIAVMGYGAKWTNDKDKYISKEYIPHFLNFLEITVSRYKGMVDAWQIWNEPNIHFWKGAKKEYYELARLSAQRIRETDPTSYIIGGGFWRAPRGFIKGMYKAGSLKNLDALSIHPYSTNASSAVRVHHKLTDIMNEVNFTGDIWVTEIGYPTGGLYPTGVSMKNLPKTVIKTIVGYAARETRALLWYEFKDPFNEGKSPSIINSENYFGLTYPNRTKKNGGWAYELCARYLPYSKYVKEIPEKENVPSNINAFCFMEGITGNNVLILWNDRNSSQKLKITLGTSFVLHDISTGESAAMPDETTLSITNVPVFITWEGSSVSKISRI